MSYQAALLTLSPEPFPDEPLLGYLLRLSQDNGLQKSSWICQATGLPVSDISLIATFPWDLTHLSEYSGVPIFELQRMAYWPSDRAGHLHYFGNPVREDLVTVRHRRVCPACLLESPYHRAIWDLSVATVCPAHGLRLIASCSGCRKRLDWRAGSITQCPCGQDLRSAPRVSVPDYLKAAVGTVAGSLGAQDAGDRIWLAFQLGWVASGAQGIGRPISLLRAGWDTSEWMALGLGAEADFQGFLGRLCGFGTPGQIRWRLARAFRVVKVCAPEHQKGAWTAEISGLMRV